jgi:predicted nucleic acid-binding protein
VKVFLDTNILVDVLLERQPFYGESARVWSLAYENKITGFVSALTYPNIHYIIRRLAGVKQADKALGAIRSAFKTVDLDDQILNQAMQGGHQDFEDAIQLFSALRADADYIITRDPGHFRTSSIPVASPVQFKQIM